MGAFSFLRKFFICIVLACPCYSGLLLAQKATKNDTRIYLADPTIFYNKATYYLYGTVESNAGNGFKVYTSPDMTTWAIDTSINNGFALTKGSAFGTKGFWAPQVFGYKNIFYMAYVANENIAIATSNSPSGSFVQNNLQALQASVKQIDPFVFVDDDGKKYLYHVRLTGGNKIFVAQMKDDFSAILPETLQQCITASEPWENTANANWPVTEGPSILKHKKLYYLFYTANDFRNPDYAVGYATSSTPYGPWKKYAGNPIISKKDIGINGTGHGDFVKDAHQNLWYVFHTHFSDSVATPRRTAIIKVKFVKNVHEDIDKVVIDKKSFRFLKMAK